MREKGKNKNGREEKGEEMGEVLLEVVKLGIGVVFLRLLADVLCKSSTWQTQKKQPLVRGCSLIFASPDFLIASVIGLSYSMKTSFNSIITLWPRACFLTCIV